jgi:hypothetical protein
MVKLTEEAFSEKWQEVLNYFNEDINQVVTRDKIVEICNANNIPDDFIETHFKGMIDYCDGKKVEDLELEEIGVCLYMVWLF